MYSLFNFWKPKEEISENWDEDCVFIEHEKSALEQSVLTSSHIISSGYPTPYCKSLNELDYEQKPLDTSSHPVYKGKSKLDNSTQYIKISDSEPMTHCESFMGHLYELILLYGVGRSYARFDNAASGFSALSSKELSNFKTFKDDPLTEQQLADAAYRHRFIRILNAFYIMREDDGHSGNISSNLKVFDADCALWGGTNCAGEPVGTYLIKGPRKFVDNLPAYIVRNPAKAFNVTAKDILHFPNIENCQPWYFPCIGNYFTSFISNNPWTSAEINLVQELEHDPATRNICFEMYLDRILDIALRFPKIAALHIPDHLKLPGMEDKKIVDAYCEMNTAMDKEYWDLLPMMPEFTKYLEENSEKLLIKIISNAKIRNYRLLQDSQSAELKFSVLFEDALVYPVDIIKRFNQFVGTMPQPSPLIGTAKAKELMAKGSQLALEEIALEEQFGKEEWTNFSTAPIYKDLEVSQFFLVSKL